MTHNEPERVDLGEIDCGVDPSDPDYLDYQEDAERRALFSVTDGGLAEAGFRYLGEIVGDGPTFEPTRRTEQ